MVDMSGLKRMRDHLRPDDAAFVWILLPLGNGAEGKCGQRGRFPCALLRPAQTLLLHMIRTRLTAVRLPVGDHLCPVEYVQLSSTAGIFIRGGRLSSGLRNAHLIYAMHLMVDHGWRDGSTSV